MLFVLIFASTLGAASPLNHTESVVIIVANRLLLSDINDAQLPVIHKMMTTGAVGLISPNCAGAKTEASVMLTANLGAPARGGWFVKEFYDSNEVLSNQEIAAHAYKLRTGRKAPHGSALFLSLGPASREAAKLNYKPSSLGALGDGLRSAGIKTRVVGNADLTTTIDRSAAALVMDSRGIIDRGRLARQVSGYRDFADELPSSLDRSVTTVYFGASTQLDEQKSAITDAAFAKHKTKYLRELNDLLGDLIEARPDVTTILVSFAPPYSTNWDQLTPIIVYPTQRAGLLITSATRTAGIVAASDFAATVLSILGQPISSDMLGRPAQVVSSSRAVERLESVGIRASTSHRLLLPVGIGLGVIGTLAFTSAACVIAFSLRLSRRAKHIILLGILICASTPCALFLAAGAPAGTAQCLKASAAALIALLALSLVITHIVRRNRRFDEVRAIPVLVVYALTALAIIVDAVTGGALCKHTTLSSYQISAMRFYGIGNEYAGVLIPTAALVAISVRRFRWAVVAIGAVVIVTLGMGNLGANYGGTAAAVVTFFLIWFAVTAGAFGLRHVLAAFVCGVAIVPIFAALDWRLSAGSGAHAAQAAGLAEHLGGGYIVALALRKALFNLKTTFSVKGISVLAAFTPFLTLWFCGVKGKLSSSLKGRPQLLAGSKAIMAGAAAAFLFNDSGIVFAMAMIAMTVIMLLYFLMEEVIDASNRST